ncbi:MAG: DUF4386 domain-containing protein [Alphaproteobacteria bacterium]|nr:DUF4386 domain-containing protein [Alphaproteobacteria bacterium]
MKSSHDMQRHITSDADVVLRDDNPVWAFLVATLYHVAGLTIGFFTLVLVFDFPDILREPAPERLARFMGDIATIVPAYYLLALTGLTQAVLAVLIWLCAPRRDEPMLVLAVLFGVLCGTFQIMGFIRWPIVIPYLAEAMASAPDANAQSVVILLEGVMNRYAGMAIGEHLGFLGMGFWTLFLGVAIVRQPFVDRSLGRIGIGLGVLTLAVAMEPLGGPFAPFAELTGGLFAFWTTWLVLMAVNLIRCRRGDIGKRDLPMWIWGIGLTYALITLIPTYVS